MKSTHIFLIFFSVFTFLSSASFVPAKKALIQTANYDSCKTDLNTERARLASLYKSASTEEGKKKILSDAGKYLQRSLTEKMFPCWYGTTWDFNGYTDKPKEGKIACGYFVSTLLKHSGFNLNRFKLAQQHSYSIAKTLNSGTALIAYRNVTRDNFIASFKSKQKEGLYVVGLDYHVGFILYEGGEMYFIHASYRSPVEVVREKASESLALNDSKVFLLANINNNSELLKKWLEKTEIKII